VFVITSVFVVSVIGFAFFAAWLMHQT